MLQTRQTWIVLATTNRADVVDARGTPTVNTVKSVDLLVINQDCILLPDYCRKHVVPNLVNQEVP